MTTARLRKVAPVGEESALLQYFAMCGVWALSTYTACDLRCAYCVSYAQGPSEPRVPPDRVADQLGEELARIPPDAVVCVGALIDGYPNAERQAGVTRRALEYLIAQERELVIVTKGETILRDLDLLSGYRRVRVSVSLPSLDDAALHRLESGVVSASRRLEVVRCLHDAGVPVELLVQPWIPGLTDAEAMIDATVRDCRRLVTFASGAS
jgi:DNA repair photolyase